MNISALHKKIRDTFVRGRSGFTLIELLVVIGILAILLAIVLVAINPGRQFQQANETKSSSDVNALLNAIHQFAADNRGNLPFTIAADTFVDVSTDLSDGMGAGAAAFCTALIPTYMAALPVEPNVDNGNGPGAPIEPVDCADVGGWDTGYKVSRSATDNRITVSTQDDSVVVIR